MLSEHEDRVCSYKTSGPNVTDIQQQLKLWNTSMFPTF